MKGREERVISGELKPSVNSGGARGGFNFEEEEEIEVLVDKGKREK